MRLRILIPVTFVLMIATAILISQLSPWKPMGRSSAISDSRSDLEIVQPGGVTSNLVTANPVSVPNQGKRPRGFSEIVDASNSALHLFAKVIDQFDQPVSEARVEFSVTRWHAVWPFSFASKLDRIVVTSDTNGWIDYDAGRGSTLSILGVTKPGLDLEMSPRCRCGFGDAEIATGRAPTRQSPMILSVGRSVGKDLVLQKMAGHSLTSSVPVYLDLVSCKIQAEMTRTSDLKLVLNAGAPGPEYGYSSDRGILVPIELNIEALKGGVARSQSFFLYEAPVSKYSRVVSIKRSGDLLNPSTDAHWLVPIYFVARDHFYGALLFRISESDSGGEFDCSITRFLNPSGARILQPDPLQSDKASHVDVEELSRQTALP